MQPDWLNKFNPQQIQQGQQNQMSLAIPKPQQTQQPALGTPTQQQVGGQAPGQQGGGQQATQPLNAESSWLQNPYDAPTLPEAQPYKANYTKGSIANIIDSIGKNLAPNKAFNDTLTYDQYAAPQREAFNLWEQQMYRPEFEQQTLNPWRDQAGRQMAGSGSFRTGASAGRYDQARTQVEQPYYDNLEQARGQYENMMRGGYNTQMERYYDSPIAFGNFR